MKKLLNSGIFWTIVTACIGIACTVAFYEFGKKELEISYYIKKLPSKIFDRDNASSKIQVHLSDSTVIEDNVYVTNFVIWNSGELEIKKSDVREQITIEGNDIEILDFSIVDAVYPDISNFNIVVTNGVHTLDWDYFDPSFGLEVQVIYAGTDESELKINGYVLGSNIVKYKTPKQKSPTSKWYLLVSMFITITCIWMVMRHFVFTNREWSAYFIVMAVMVGIQICTTLYLIYNYQFAGAGLPFYE